MERTVKINDLTFAVREKIKKLVAKNPNVHINVNLSKPRINLKNESVKITGVYAHIFQIEEYSTGVPVRYTLQYADILIKNIEILELLN